MQEAMNEEDEKHICEIKQHAIEMKEMLELSRQCDVDNTIHAAKIMRAGDLHIAKAKLTRAKLQGEILKMKRHKNSCKMHGVKNL